jgi:hypothetical protein
MGRLFADASPILQEHLYGVSPLRTTPELSLGAAPCKTACPG